jgi:hypothetical protein
MEEVVVLAPVLMLVLLMPEVLVLKEEEEEEVAAAAAVADGVVERPVAPLLLLCHRRTRENLADEVCNTEIRPRTYDMTVLTAH